MMTTRPADHLAREQALDPNGSFAVTAPAGSGKTGLLTKRVLTLLPLCENPEEVMCITFTRKAATEMQERITQALRSAAEEPRPDSEHEQQLWDLAHKVLEHDKVRSWQLLKNPNRLRIQTIDGLCRSLINHNPLTSGAGGSGNILDDAASEAIYRQAVEKTLQSLEQESSLREPLAKLLVHMDNNLESLNGLLIKLLQCREQWLSPIISAREARQYLESVLEELVSDALYEASELLLPYASDLCLLADYAGANCVKLKPGIGLCQLAGISGLPECESEQLPDWRLLCDLLLTKQNDWRSPRGLTVACGFPTETDTTSKAEAKDKKAEMGHLITELSAIPKLLSLLTQIRVLPDSQYTEQQWIILDALTHVLPFCVAQLKLVFRQLNASDFIEIAQGAIESLGGDEEPTDLALILDYQIKHILVDEFQDTASPQLQLLERLTRGWQLGEGRSLFIVGDGMQSCYGFRNANVGIFLDARAHGIGDLSLQALELTVNFRSQSGIVDWVNDTFMEAFPDSDDIARGAVTYAPSIAFKPALEELAVSSVCFTASGNRQAEAEHVVNLVRSARQQHPEDKVAILVRFRSHLRDIIPALQNAGLDWQATDIDPLASRMAIVDLMTLTRAMLDPSDRIAWLALLRSPWCGLDNHDLHCLATRTQPRGDDNSSTENKAQFSSVLDQLLCEGLALTSQRKTVAEQALSAAGHKILKRFIAIIHQAMKSRRRKPLRLWLEGLWVALGGPDCLADSTDYSNGQDFFALLERHEKGGAIESWNTFERAVAKLYARPSTTADPHIQVMTIHKSKGLEFEHVIIPGLDRNPRADDKQLLLWKEHINKHHESQLLLSPLSAFGDDTDGLYKFLEEERKLKAKLESIRLLYVGCTRAIKHLHLLGEVSIDSKKNEVKKPSASNFLGSLWASIAHNHRLVEVQELENESTESQLPSFIKRLPADWLRPVTTSDNLLASYRGREFDDEENLPTAENFNNRAARHTGTLLHRSLCQIVVEGLDNWNEARIERQKPSWRVQLQQMGIMGESLEKGLADIEKAIVQMLSDPTGRWLLDSEHPESAVELELWSSAKTPRLSIIDRTFVADGERWIVDYKSSTPKPEQDREEFLAQEREHYSEQLMRYRQLFSDIEQRPIKTALYFPHFQHMEVVEFSL